ncbi:cryptochrome/photolyase family protein [Rheinheimera marina]|uniref:Cryptochrome/photolyase family protein n=1 Tax=Rheinheimera marina TaxID=1774958 RepID=A0ABV9JN64_9GAMM
MATLRVILGDQLSPALPTLSQVAEDDWILMAEVQTEAHYCPHHKHKIIVIFSAMRHFAESLRGLGYQLRYIRFDEQVRSLTDAVALALTEIPGLQHILLTEPGEYRVGQEIAGWAGRFNLPVTSLEDSRFLISRAQFSGWAAGKRQLRMEYFYREMRKHTGLLMQDGQPAGGQWNFDSSNRKALPAELTIPAPLSFEPDLVTQEVQALVARHFPTNMGDASQFRLAVSGKQARQAFLHFLTQQLPLFGDYQDAMRIDQPFLFHSVCSIYLNCGLLDARWMCSKVVLAWQQGLVPLNAAEGFIRQIIGWREYVRGLYWLQMPGYKTLNSLNAATALPEFYWHGQTKMRCMQQAIEHTKRYAYSHHIQRLMITGNFALLAGLDVQQVCNWYLAVYADAYEWVELPNTLGMALFADNGILASKPYAASGKYIARMSNYCKHCHYDVNDTTGDNACPFNALYWDFLARNQSQLQTSARLQFSYKNWDMKTDADKQRIRNKAQQLLIQLEQL